MAQYALPPGAVRRRAAFGLFDADGWTWAGIKAFFWFLLIIFVLGYLPDRAYYFTVLPTLDLGYNVISPINMCPPENRSLPCPAPAGAIVPWDTLAGEEAALPDGRAGAGVFTSGEVVYLVGGRTADGPTDSVLTTKVDENGNLGAWEAAEGLPEARDEAAVVNLSGTPYVIGGLDPSGTPTATVFRGTIAEGKLTGWESVDELALPAAVAGAGAVSSGNGIYVFGGRTEDGLSTSVHAAELSTTGTPTLAPWQELTELPLPEPRAEATAVIAGNLVYVIGGEGPEGTTNSVFFLSLDTGGQPEVDRATGRPRGWGVSAGQAASFALPEARSGATGFSNSGAIYVVGGHDADGNLATTNFWAEPNVVDGTIPDWNQRSETDLPDGRAEATAAIVGPQIYFFGGETADGLATSSTRARLAPALPFFRVGLFGLTIPAMAIGGEIGQQLGYIAAGTVGAGAFVLLTIIGWLYSHPSHTRRLIVWSSRGRIRAPVEEE
jgi:N-acetylneuraminic acid mutarotase